MEQKTGGARVCALKILYKIEQEGAFANIALKEAAGLRALSAPDQGPCDDARVRLCAL